MEVVIALQNEPSRPGSEALCLNLLVKSIFVWDNLPTNGGIQIALYTLLKHYFLVAFIELC
jgi:hypothetical protein